jgi:hypothetical protein
MSVHVLAWVERLDRHVLDDEESRERRGHSLQPHAMEEVTERRCCEALVLRRD